MLNLYKIKNNIILNVAAKLTLEILSGSLNINSSTIGKNNAILKILNKLKFISSGGGHKLKYFKGIDKPNPVIKAIVRRIKNDFHTNFKKEKIELISNCLPKPGFFRNKIKSLKSIIHK